VGFAFRWQASSINEGKVLPRMTLPDQEEVPWRWETLWLGEIRADDPFWRTNSFGLPPSVFFNFLNP